MALKLKNIEGKQIKKKAQQFKIALKNRKELQLQAKVSKTKKVRDVKSKFLISIVITVYVIFRAKVSPNNKRLSVRRIGHQMALMNLISPAFLYLTSYQQLNILLNLTSCGHLNSLVDSAYASSIKKLKLKFLHDFPGVQVC